MFVAMRRSSAHVGRGRRSIPTIRTMQVARIRSGLSKRESLRFQSLHMEANLPPCVQPSMGLQSDFLSAGERTSERHLIGELKLASMRHPARDARHLDAGIPEDVGQIEGRGL